YLDDIHKRLKDAGLGDEFNYRGVLDRPNKIAFLRELDVMSVPATYDEPKGVSLLEAMACGVPLVQPRRGAFTEIVESTGGGLLVPADSAEALADALFSLYRDGTTLDRLSARAFAGVRERYSVARSTDRLIEV